MVGSRRRTGTGLFSLLIGLSVLSLVPSLASDAHACGGCFLPENGESTVVTSHRMALSLSTERTVLWDQIQYQGDPQEFAWVLPVKPGTVIELGSDAFFEALDAGTTEHTTSPLGVTCQQQIPGDDYNYGEDYGDGYYSGGCSMTGCGSMSAGSGYDVGGSGGGAGSVWSNVPVDPEPPPVAVVHQESIGPYEAVILSSNKSGALYDWLVDHGYGIDPSMEPIVDAYEAEEFDFVALRLIPGANVKQMRPVRVTMPGASPVLPLRMVAAGTGANVAMTLFVLGEGKWMPQNFGSDAVQPGAVVWDYATSSSNYGQLREQALAGIGGATWITTFAKPGSLLGPVYNPVSMGNVVYQASNGQNVGTMGELFAQQAFINGETSDTNCMGYFTMAAQSGGKVVDPCGELGQEDPGMGGAGGATQTGGSGGMGGSVMTGGSGGVGGSTSTGGSAMGGSGVGGSTQMGGSGGSMSTGGVGGVATGGAGGATEPDTCAHSFCSAGDALEFGCNTCATQVCQQDPSCCLSGWTDACIATAGVVCGVVCGPDGLPCEGKMYPGDVRAQDLVCGELDDMAVALLGMHPGYVWVTRLEANLPKAALANDLVLMPDPNQVAVENWISAATYTGDPCTVASAPVARKPTEPKKRPPAGPGDMVAIGLTLAAVLGAAGRRALRKVARVPA